MTIKKLLKIIIWPAILLSLWYIIPHQLNKQEKSPYIEYISYVNEIREAFAAQILNDQHLICVGDSGKMHEKVEEMGLQFKANRRATVEEARALQLHVMNKLVEAVNTHPKLQPFLAERPFTHKHVTISISFEDSNGSHADGIAWIHNIPDSAGAVENRNKLFYYTLDPYTGKLTDLFDEPYDKAFELVQASLPMKLEKSYPFK